MNKQSNTARLSLNRVLPHFGGGIACAIHPLRLGRADLRSADSKFAFANFEWRWRRDWVTKPSIRIVARILPGLVAISIAGAAMGQQAVSPETFEALSEGYTLHFSQNGSHYGSEQFLENRRTVWRDGDGRCVNGKWTDVGEEMCFIYDDGSGIHCWTMYREGNQLFVLSTNDPPERDPTLLELSRTDRVPINCIGPRVGV